MAYQNGFLVMQTSNRRLTCDSLQCQHLKHFEGRPCLYKCKPLRDDAQFTNICIIARTFIAS
jgi:hypothetical protein